MVSEVDVAWAAGIFEGEGCIGVYKKDHGRHDLVVRVVMSDKDIIERLNTLFPTKRGIKTITFSCGRKTCWLWALYAKEPVISFLQKVYPYLGIRRKSKADELFKIADMHITAKQYYSRCSGIIYLKQGKASIETLDNKTDFINQSIESLSNIVRQ